MNNMQIDDRYFRLTNFYTAAFLFAKGLELVNIDRSEPRRCQFVFLDTPEREALVQNFNFGKEDSQGVTLDARKLVMAIKMLKDKLYQERL
ncbi:MAG: DUF5659 domain-containing protein [Candidatus Levybacteria bacterium]|nr:DUF5659 domain-containing protein [Candidatus Levybacteria bacterium]